ncbi:MAG: hypothetical protein KKF43_09285 [Proteobacteria bacterium]|nr:hypothetical protein [Pseudomonadota bacterium]
MRDNSLLAMIDNYHLSRENASFDIIIWHPHLWGGRFQMAVIGERQVTGGNGRIIQAKRAGYALNMEGFWLGDKFLIRAGSESAIDSLNWQQTG